jgi:hypothetical protein
MPGQPQATRVTMQAQQQRRCLRINDGNNAIMIRATLAIAKIAKLLAH